MYTQFSYDDSWIILSEIEHSIRTKVEEKGIPLEKWDISINYGIKTGLNEAFIISEPIKDELIRKDPKSAEIIRPILRGRDIQKYHSNFAGLWLISTFPSLEYCIDDYPAVKEYLLSFGYDRLSQTGEKKIVDGKIIKSRKKTNNKWFETQDSIKYWDEFFKQKIIYPNMTKYMPFVLDDEQYMTNQKCFIITGEHLPFLTAFFNSSLFKYCFRDSFPELQGGTRELSKIFFEKIPVIRIDEQLNQSFANAVKNIQKEYTDEKAKEIDEMIFDLYELSSAERDEIGFIEIK